METFDISTKKGNVIHLNIPTDLSEISPDYLTKVTNHITIADEYSLVAVIYRDSLANIINSRKNKKDTNVAVIIEFVKAGKTNNTLVNSAKTGDILVVSGADISIGNHVSCVGNDLSLARFLALADESNDLYKKALARGFEKDYFIEFKLIPNSALKGIIGKNPVKSNEHIFIEVNNKGE